MLCFLNFRRRSQPLNQPIICIGDRTDTNAIFGDIHRPKCHLGFLTFCNSAVSERIPEEENEDEVEEDVAHEHEPKVEEDPFSYILWLYNMC
ncbi:hypothetical protein GCK32_013210 [Trichostrongylus colubriformis]|uniref:Uncharacterized protein n=1 Tax=Trichostrongylus colubriformis TaxID=6319 RepID=A0AAN8F0T4_TRICO